MSEVRGIPLYKWFTLHLALVCHDISPRAFQLFARLIDHHNHRTKQCNPSQETLALALDCSTRSVRTAQNELETAGLIKVIKGPGIPAPNNYEINFFQGDKHAYRQAEKSCLLRRKKSSGKPKKEPKKLLLRKRAIKTSQEKATDALYGTRGIAHSRARLESAVVQRLGDTERGYLALGALPDEMLDALAAAVRSDELSFGKAVTQILEASELLAGGA